MADLNNDILINHTSENNDDDKDCTSSSNLSKSSFFIYDTLIEKTELERLINSHEPEDRKELNHLVLKIVETDDHKAFEYLLDHGYKVDVLNSKGQTAVHIGFYNEYMRCRKTYFDFGNTRYGERISYLISCWMLENSIDLEYVDCNGLTYLHVICFLDYDPIGDAKLISKCLKSRIDVNAKFHDPTNHYDNFTALHFAVINGSINKADIVKKILVPVNTKVDPKDSLNRTPLHLACQVYEDPNKFDVHNHYVGEILDKSCRLAPCIFEKLRDFYMISIDIIDLLMQAGANVNLKDKNGNTPLLSIFPDSYDEFERFDTEWYNYEIPIKETTLKFAYLLEHGAKVNMSNKNGDTILHLITRNLKAYRTSSEHDFILFDDHYHLEMIKHIFKSKTKVNVNSRNKKGETPIQLAIESMSIDVVQLLLNHGAKLKHLFSDVNNETSFAYPDVVPNFVTTQNVMAITELLLSKSVDITPKSKLIILNFLVHIVNKCDCPEYRYLTLFHGSKSHILEKILFISTHDLKYYYYPICIGDLYIDKEVEAKIKKVIDEKEYSLDIDIFMINSKLQAELVLMKSTKVTDDFNLHDLMIRHPHNVPYIIAKNFDYNVLKGLTFYENYVKAHLTKTVLRRLIERMCGSSLEVLCLPLPGLCCQLILGYLSNQDIVKVYSIVNYLI